MGNRIKKLVSSKFMGLVISLLAIFDTGAIYSCYPNKAYFVNLEDKILSRKLKVIAKGLDISGLGIVEYSVNSESGCMIAT